jgi:Ras-related protein Rab-1A
MGSFGSKNKSNRKSTIIKRKSGATNSGPSSTRTSEVSVKILVIGDVGVGKTSLVLRYTENKFDESQIPTLVGDYCTRSSDVDGKVIKMQLWDTNGRERFNALTSSFYRGAHGILFAFSLSDSDSFASLENWMNSVEQFAREKVVRFVVGLKNDLTSSRTVQYETAEAFAQKHNMTYLECSAKNNNGVEEVFSKMANSIKDNLDDA